jgi:hypothetical protein
MFCRASISPLAPVLRVLISTLACSAGRPSIRDAAGLELVHDSQPELGTLALLDPQPGALLASAIENRVLLELGALIPRRLVLDGTGYIMENGVGRDMASNGMVYQFHHVRFGSMVLKKGS